MRVVLSQTEKEMNVNNTKITAPINQLIFSLLVRECLLIYLSACFIRLIIFIQKAKQYSRVRLLFLGLFFWGCILIKGTKFINIFILICFTVFLLAIYKNFKLTVILLGLCFFKESYVYCFCQMSHGLRLFKGLCLFWTHLTE